MCYIKIYTKINSETFVRQVSVLQHEKYVNELRCMSSSKHPKIKNIMNKSNGLSNNR